MTIPDQLSVDPAYPGYRPDWQDVGTDLMISLNGIEQKMVLAYDRSLGRVVRLEQDVDGKAVVRGDDWSIETVHGAVTIDRLVERRANP